MTPPTGDHKGPPIPSPPPSPLRMLILIGRPQWHAPTIYDSLWLSPFAQGLSCFAALNMTGLYIWLTSYEFCAFAPLDGASPVPTIYGWMASNEFCHIHYTLVWAELQDLLDKSCGEILRLAQDDTGMQLRLMLIRVDNGNEQYSRDIVKATEGR